MASRTGPCVGPGSYGVGKAIQKLKQKPCMAKFSQTFIQDEDCYEIVNNIRVLQPKYLKGKDKKLYDKNIECFQRNRLLRRISETYVHQRSIADQQYEKSGEQSHPTRSRNNLHDEISVDYQMLERPRTQQNIYNGGGRQRSKFVQSQYSKFQTLNQETQLEGNDLIVGQRNNIMDIRSMQNVKAQRAESSQKQMHNHTYSLIDRSTLMNGSTNASFEQYGKNQSQTTGLSSIKSKSKNGSEFGIRIRNQSSIGNRKRLDKNKKYIRNIIDNNLYVDDAQNYNTSANFKITPQMNLQNEPKNRNQYSNQQPFFEEIEVNLNPQQYK
ncbi:UNKNOWN [Stylonychia lemnae]|uniref:Uncharacterized protein n=1 Tax=Stylonychia lemnae TaxID=5949 RepID=A0A078ASY4_STYLE|nr:UNKNOWN [Stylonychia lemnae]|eukprot:CDW85299.1 UNKNOWN [Stylonychia lemnae]